MDRLMERDGCMWSRDEERNKQKKGEGDREMIERVRKKSVAIEIKRGRE